MYCLPTCCRQDSSPPLPLQVRERIVGLIALTAAVALTVLACIIASGCCGGGFVYLTAAGVLMSSVIPYILAAHLLSKPLDVS